MTYRVARAVWRGGDREVVFPLGTYGMFRLHGARVAQATGPPVME